MVAKLREVYERALLLPEAEQERLAGVLEREVAAADGVEVKATDDDAQQLTAEVDRRRPDWAKSVQIHPRPAQTPEERQAVVEELLRHMDEHPGNPEPGWKFNREELYDEVMRHRLRSWW